MSHPIHTVLNHHFELLPEKALFWQERETLIVSDIHLGKASHFRKAGLPVPPDMGKSDLEQLLELTRRKEASELIILGDLFHSEINIEWEWFKNWLSKLGSTKVLLIEGNHDRDIIKESETIPIPVTDQLIIDHLIFTHEPIERPAKGTYNICGHLHPGVKLRGKGRQSLRLPCFWFGKKRAVLPAFGNLTGYVSIPKNKADVYAIHRDSIYKV